ncbi:response regulator transcription factor [Actinomycetaceae bacterium L2_0104]
MNGQATVTTVLIAEDQLLLRKSLATIIDSAPDLRVIGEAETGQEAISVARELSPDVILMDIRMPGLNGIDATAAITADPVLASTRVLILTMFELDEYIEAALRAGARGFLLKDAAPDVLLDGIRRVCREERIYAPAVLEKMVASFLDRSTRARENPRAVAGLTKREIEVLTLIARGRSNSEIAGDLFISMATVKTHIGNLLAKMQARDRAQLVILAYESGLADR